MYKSIQIFKIITLGNAGVGKTSILKRYISGQFEENLCSTIGIEFSIKELTLKNGKSIKLKIIDTCGQEIYKSISKSYFKNSDAVFFVFALNNKKSFIDIQDWINLFGENHNGKENVPKILVGNKSDIESKDIDQTLINKFAEEKNIKYIETSAKDNLNINKIFEDVAEILYDDYIKSGLGNKPQNAIKVGENKMKKKPCCIGSSDL